MSVEFMNFTKDPEKGGLVEHVVPLVGFTTVDMEPL